MGAQGTRRCWEGIFGCGKEGGSLSFQEGERNDTAHAQEGCGCLSV